MTVGTAVDCHVRVALMMLMVLILGTVIVMGVTTDGANKPGCAARSLPGPVLLEIVLARFKVTTRNENDKTDDAVENGIDENSTEKGVSAALLEGQGVE